MGQFVQRLAGLLGYPVPEKVRPFWLARAGCGVRELFGRWLGRPLRRLTR